LEDFVDFVDFVDLEDFSDLADWPDWACVGCSLEAMAGAIADRMIAKGSVSEKWGVVIVG
jgi:hypothetical protein